MITSKFNVALRISTMIPAWETGNPISKSASDFGLLHEGNKIGLWFSERQSPFKIDFLFLNEELFWILLCKMNFALQNHLPPVSLPSKIEIVATPSERHLPTALNYSIQGNWFWKWFWTITSEGDLDFKWAIRLREAISSIKKPSRNRFSKAPPASSMLNLSHKS